MRLFHDHSAEVTQWNWAHDALRSGEAVLHDIDSFKCNLCTDNIIHIRLDGLC